jgi:hypothetical protein
VPRARSLAVAAGAASGALEVHATIAVPQIKVTRRRRHHRYRSRSRRGLPQRAVQIRVATPVAMRATATVTMGGLARSITFAAWVTTALTAEIGATQLTRALTAARRA